LQSFTLADGTKIKKGDLGGYVDSPKNLAQAGNSWILPGACAADDAYVSGEAIVGAGSYIFDDARVYGRARVDGSVVRDSARIYGNAEISGASLVEQEAAVSGDSIVLGGSILTDKVRVRGGTEIEVQRLVIDNSTLQHTSKVVGLSQIHSQSFLRNNAFISGGPVLKGTIVEDAATVDGTTDKFLLKELLPYRF
jgi:carbonic anhydrase/acetyltransferase-like protein (isoleucine patch superfamily)